MKITSLKILTDENISPRIVSFLRQKGLDVVMEALEGVGLLRQEAEKRTERIPVEVWGEE